MKKFILLVLIMLTGMTLSACQNGSSEVDCNEGYEERNGKCYAVTPTCSDGYELIDNECLEICADGYERVEGECEEIVLTCNEGFEVVGDECLAVCADGYERVEGECEEIVLTCDEGFEVVGDECLAVCADGYERVEGECQEIPLVCDEGFEEVNGECTQITCIPGYILEGSECVPEPSVCSAEGYNYDRTSLEYDLVWEDNFDGTTLDESKWTYEVNGSGGGNNEEQFYTSQNIVLEDGIMKIIAKKEDYNGWDYTSSRIVTRNNAEFKYGIFEASIKLPGGNGTWPAFWMMPVNSVYGGWPDSGEMDIVELVGYDPTKIHGSIHTDRFNHKEHTQKGGVKTVSTATSEFHTYKLEWLPDMLIYSVDDVPYYMYIPSNFAACPDHEEWPFDKTFYMILNVAIGGDWGGVQGIDDSIFPVAMEVDWVRVYQSDEITNLEQTSD